MTLGGPGESLDRPQDEGEVALNRAIMEAMGFHPDVVRADGRALDTVRYSASLDALSAGPEKVLREAGWWLTVKTGDYTLASWENQYTYYRAHADTEAEARAKAALLTLQALESSKE